MPAVSELVDRAAARTPWRDTLHGPQDGDAWWSLSDVEQLPVEQWYGDLLDGVAKGHRDVAGSYLSSYVVDPFVSSTASALVHDRTTWPVEPSTFQVHRHEDGWFDGLAISADRTWAVGQGFGSDDELIDAVADGIVAIARPWFDMVRALAPYGRIGMWGLLADGIGDAALRGIGTDLVRADAAWERSQRLVDAIAAREPTLRTKPPRRRIRWAGGDAWVHTQGTCCLYFKVADPDDGEVMCLGCPLRPDGESDPLFAEWIEREQAEAEVSTSVDDAGSE